VERSLIEIALSILPTSEDHDTENPPSRTSYSPPTIPELEVDNDEPIDMVTSESPVSFKSWKKINSMRKRATTAFLTEQETKKMA
jgi:hypothetical protein